MLFHLSGGVIYRTVREAERRQNLLDNLSSREIQLNNLFREDPSQSSSQRLAKLLFYFIK